MPNWFISTDYTPTGGPVSATASPGSIGGSWVDTAGSNWSIDSSNLLHCVAISNSETAPWNTRLLARLDTSVLLLDQQFVIRATCSNQQGLFVALRASRGGSSTTGYLIGHNAQTNVVAFYTCTSGNATQVGSNVAMTLTSGTVYDYTFSVSQTNASSSLLTLSVADTSGNQIGTASYTDTTSAFQGVAGGVGVFPYPTVASATTPISINRLRYYTDRWAVGTTATASGNVAASASPGNLGNGLTDVSGNIWSIQNSFYRSAYSGGTPWKNAILGLLSLSQLNLQASVTYVASSSDTIFIQLRLIGATGTPQSYLVGLYSAAGTSFGLFYQNGTTVNQIGNLQPSGTTTSSGNTYTVTASIIQTTSTSSTITVSLYNASGQQIGSEAVFNDTTSAMQNVNGAFGVVESSGNNTVSTIGISSITTYTDQGASPGTGGGGTGATLYLNDPSVVLSPYNWDKGSTGVTSATSIYPGAYARFYLKNTTGATINFDTSYTSSSYRVQIDNNAPSTISQVPSGGTLALTIPDVGSHVVTVYFAAQPGSTTRWANGARFGLQSLLLGNGGVSDPSSATAGKRSKNAIFYGDSICQGILANNGSDDNLDCYSFLVGQALLSMGYEYGVIGISGQGYSNAVTPDGGCPPAFTVGNDTSSSWNKINANTSRLTSGKFSPLPDIVLDEWGRNDLGSSSVPTILPQFYTALRAACGSATQFIKMIPFDGTRRADIVSAVNSYMSSSGDKIYVADLNIDSRISSGAYTSTDQIHPNIIGHAFIASQLSGKITSAIDAKNAVAAAVTKPPYGGSFMRR